MVFRISIDVDSCIETLKSGECVSERELKHLCSLVSELLMEESNVQPVMSPVTIVGDIHGQFFDLINLFKAGMATDHFLHFSWRLCGSRAQQR
jgi:hypothetical protein